jgi:hypothetical protein
MAAHGSAPPLGAVSVESSRPASRAPTASLRDGGEPPPLTPTSCTRAQRLGGAGPQSGRFHVSGRAVPVPSEGHGRWQTSATTDRRLPRSAGQRPGAPQVARAAGRSYDISPTGYALDEAEPYVELAKKFGSTALQNAAGYESDEMDALLVELAGAATDEAKIEIIGRIQELSNEDTPGSVLSHRHRP